MTFKISIMAVNFYEAPTFQCALCAPDSWVIYIYCLILLRLAGGHSALLSVRLGPVFRPTDVQNAKNWAHYKLRLQLCVRVQFCVPVHVPVHVHVRVHVHVWLAIIVKVCGWLGKMWGEWWSGDPRRKQAGQFCCRCQAREDCSRKPREQLMVIAIIQRALLVNERAPA